MAPFAHRAIPSPSQSLVHADGQTRFWRRMSTSDALLHVGLLLFALLLLIAVINPLLRAFFRRVKRTAARPEPTLELSSGDRELFVMPSVATRQARWNSLTNRQREACRLAAKGLSDREIAAHMHVTWTTVKSHLYVSYHKLRISSRHELRYFLEGLLD